MTKAFEKHASGNKDFLRSLFERIEEEDQLVQSIKERNFAVVVN